MFASDGLNDVMPDHAVNDILIVAAFMGAATITTTDNIATSTTGWNEAYHNGYVPVPANTGNMFYIFWKRATSTTGEGPSMTSTTTGLFTIPYVFRGCITTGTPFETYGSSQLYTATCGAVGGTRPSITGAAVSGSNIFTACFTGLSNDTGWSSGHPPADWSAVTFDAPSTGTDVGFVLMTRTLSATSYDVTVGVYGSSDYWTLILVPFLAAPETTKHNLMMMGCGTA